MFDNVHEKLHVDQDTEHKPSMSRTGVFARVQRMKENIGELSAAATCADSAAEHMSILAVMNVLTLICLDVFKIICITWLT